MRHVVVPPHVSRTGAFEGAATTGESQPLATNASIVPNKFATLLLEHDHGSSSHPHVDARLERDPTAADQRQSPANGEREFE